MTDGSGENGPRAYTRIELVVSLGILFLLGAVLFPAIQASREAARRQQCADHLRQIGMALHDYDNRHGALPASYWLELPDWPKSCRRLNVQSWGVRILPYLGGSGTNAEYNLQVPAFREVSNWAYGYGAEEDAIAQKNIETISTPQSVFLCPAVPGGASRVFPVVIPPDVLQPGLPPMPLTWTEAASDYIVASGVRGKYAEFAYARRDLWPEGSGGNWHGAMNPFCPALGEIRSNALNDIKDGLAQTILLGERPGGPDLWMRNGGNARPELVRRYASINGGGWGDFFNGENWIEGAYYDGEADPDGGPCAMNCSTIRGRGFFSFHPGVTNLLMADGSVQVFSGWGDQFVLAHLITRENGETIPNF